MIGQTTVVLPADLESHGNKEVGEGIVKRVRGMMESFRARACLVAKPEFKAKLIKRNEKILTTITRIRKS